MLCLWGTYEVWSSLTFGLECDRKNAINVYQLTVKLAQVASKMHSPSSIYSIKYYSIHIPCGICMQDVKID